MEDIAKLCVVRWGREDIEEALDEYGYKVDESSIEIISKQCRHDFFREYVTQSGRHLINSYIEANEHLLKKKEDNT